MKKTLKYSVLAALCVVMSLMSGCVSSLDTDQFVDKGITLAAIAPNPVMRGGELHIVGSNLENVKEVRFAGGVSVTDIRTVVTGRKGEICVTVPLEGPEVGPVTIVAADGQTSSSMADLTFTEPITIESVSPEVVLSGDVVNIRGEYLNTVKEVILGGDVYVTEFASQSRHELSFVLPFNAITGYVILSDVNEIEDQNTIPNKIYSAEELVVGQPTVVTAEKATYKSGDVIKVDGEHLDMIESVNLPQAADVTFVHGREGDWITFNLPPEATDGHILLTSYAGDTFDAGEIETVTVHDLAVKSLAEDQRYKAGSEVEITGTDLNLVTTLAFNGADDTSWYLTEGKIIAIVPADAQDGPITVTLGSGKQAYSEDIEVVKPEILAWEHFDAYVAGKTVVHVEGLDLDLVTDVTIGDKDHGFIPCEYELVTDEATGFTDVNVKLPKDAYTGPITFYSAAGYTTATDPIVITYDETISVQFDQPSYGLGNMIGISGSNLLQVDQVFIKGKRVTNYALRADDKMSFGIPDGIGPGVYRLVFVLMDGSEMTWPVPFEITAPFTEKFVWEGYEDLGSWSNQPYLGADGAFAEAGMVVGDIVRIYYTPLAGWWQYQIFGGHWEGMTFPELDGSNTVSTDNTDPDAQYFAFEVTDANIGILTTVGGWGGALLTQGEGVAITGLSLVHFGAAETRTPIWEGSSTVTWGGGAVTNLSWGGYDWSTVEAGTKIAVSYSIDDPDGCIRFGNGSWAALPSLAGLAPDGNLPLAGSGYEFELTAADLNVLVNEGGLVVCGTGYTITEIALVTTSAVGPVENPIWEGNSTVTWGGGAVTDLSWGGYDWTTVSAGTVLCLHYTIDDPDGCIRVGNGSWASIPSLAGLAPDGNLPLQDGGHEVELTAEDVDFLINNGGLVICGTGYTITQIGLK
jgi:hypothetical protein